VADCLFCGIVKGEIPSEKVYEDDRVLAFKDINPVAPVHVLLIPKEHHSDVIEAADRDPAVLGHLFTVASKLAKELGLSEKGFRVVNNYGKEGGQTVFHLHFHLIGGRQLTWPPG
jgi:histidine triad (HIT) family protein